MADNAMVVETIEEGGQLAVALQLSVQQDDLATVIQLVTAGALIESRLNGLTPLHRAVYLGHDAILTYLLSKNADPDTQDDFGNTPLLTAASMGHLITVTRLVIAGASMSVRNSVGFTPLHCAVSLRHLAGVKLLVNEGASLVEKNKQVMTPLYFAAMERSADIVEFFVSHRTCPNRERIEALELLGAAYINIDNNYNRGYHYMFLSMRERFYSASPFFNSRKAILPPVDAYGYRLECRDLQELMNIKDDHDKLHMEALMVLERVLGEDNLEVPNQINIYGNVLANASVSHFDCAISLWKRALHMKQKNIDGLIYEDLWHIDQVFTRMHSVGEPFTVKHVMDILELCVEELQRDQERPKVPVVFIGHGGEQTTETSHDMNIVSTLRLLIMVVIKKSDEEEAHLFSLVRRLNALFSPNRATNLLHVLCSVPMYGSADPALVEILLKCRANPNQMDGDGNTPLHKLVHCNRETTFIKRQIITHLIKFGAHIDYANNNGAIVSDAVTTMLGTNRHIFLKCLAARAVCKHQIPYVGQVPLELYEFIEMHGC